MLLDSYYRMDRWRLWYRVSSHDKPLLPKLMILRMTGRFGYTQDWILWVRASVVEIGCLSDMM
jgi:hypothetical protein